MEAAASEEAKKVHRRLSRIPLYAEGLIILITHICGLKGTVVLLFDSRQMRLKHLQISSRWIVPTQHA